MAITDDPPWFTITGNVYVPLRSADGSLQWEAVPTEYWGYFGSETPYFRNLFLLQHLIRACPEMRFPLTGEVLQQTTIINSGYVVATNVFQASIQIIESNNTPDTFYAATAARYFGFGSFLFPMGTAGSVKFFNSMNQFFGIENLFATGFQYWLKPGVKAILTLYGYPPIPQVCIDGIEGGIIPHPFPSDVPYWEGPS
jgi:hypothetical protein